MVKIVVLFLSNNKYNSSLSFQWGYIDELAKLRSLRELKIYRNPILQTATDATVRSIILAKLGGLNLCNRSEVQ